MLPACVDDYVAPDALVRVVDVVVASLNLAELGFGRTVARPQLAAFSYLAGLIGGWNASPMSQGK